MEQRTPEWLELRRTKIGASDAAAIMGISPWKTPRRLYEDKISGEIQEPTPAMQRGIDLEPAALMEFERMTGIAMSPSIVISEERPWQMASLDGICLTGNTIVEVKCGGKKVHDMARDGVLPSHYMCQVQHQICVTNAKTAFYFSFDGKEGVVVEVKRDEEFIQKLLLEEKKFWDRLMDQDPPPLTDRDYTEVLSDEWVQLSEEYKQLTQVEYRKEQIRKRLEELAGERNSKGNGIFVTKRSRKGAVHYSSIPELMGLNLEIYRKKPIEYWEVSVK